MMTCRLCAVEDLTTVEVMHIVMACKSCNARWVTQSAQRGVYMGQASGSNEARGGN